MEMITEWFINHPKAMTLILILVAAKAILGAVVDALLTVRAEIDKTPDTDDTPFEKFVTFMRLTGVFISKFAANFAGFKGQKSVKQQVSQIVAGKKGEESK